MIGNVVRALCAESGPSTIHTIFGEEARITARWRGITASGAGAGAGAEVIVVVEVLRLN